MMLRARATAVFAAAAVAMILAPCASVAQPEIERLETGERPASLAEEEILDALRALESTSDTLSVEEADELLRRAYGEQFTATERIRAFSAAAEVASREGAHAQALAWVDWAVRETSLLRAEAPELTEDVLAAAIGVALAAGDPLQMRSYLRAQASLEHGWKDDPQAAGLRHDVLDALCADVIADRYVRMRTWFETPVAGAPNLRPMRCAYAPLEPNRAPKDLTMELYAAPVWAPVRGRLRHIVERGLDPVDVAAREEVAERLTRMITQLDRNPVAGDLGRAGYALYSRPGVEPVVTLAYAVHEREGALFAVRVSADERAWPPDNLREIAGTALAAMLDAPSSVD